MYYEVIPTEVFRSGGSILTYSSDMALSAGQVVLVPLGRKKVIGIVYRKVKRVDFPTKPIEKLICPFSLPCHLLKTIFWLSQYYLTPVPLVADLVIPAGLASRNALKGYLEPLEGPSIQNCGTTALKLEKPLKAPLHKPKITQIPLNSAQKQALAELAQIPNYTKLLRGVTGSGKTNIYLQLAADTLQKNQSVILLVPEIALTSQLVKIFEETFGDRVTLIHSQQTMTERRKTWLDIITTSAPDYRAQSATGSQNNDTQAQARTQEQIQAQGQYQDNTLQALANTPEDQLASTSPNHPVNNAAKIIIGPRSALLAPLHNLGLIIIDEAHETAYYQENPPRYSALRLASFIAKTAQVPCVLGTATPNIVDYHLAQSKSSLVTLQQKAKTTAIDAKISVVDLRQREAFSRNRYFSNVLLTAIENNLQANHQTLIFHNRRGSAPLTICENCGWQALCPECFLPMTLHTDTYTLNCHICGHSEKVPSSCPSCQHVGIIHKGFGTKLLESELNQLFPNAKISRFDGDNKKDEDLASLYDEVKAGEVDILIGTQTLARGLDLPHLATVGIVQADAGLALPDFAAEERTFELLTQVIGRVGRGHLDKAEVIIQSYQPDHPVIQAAMQTDYEAFAKYLLQHRREQQMPPFTYLARLSITYKTERTTLAKIRQAYNELQNQANISVSPPAPAFHERTARGFTWQIIIKANSRETLRKALLPYAGNSQYSLVLDPPSLL